MDKIEKLKQLIEQSNKIVVLTGAGIQTDSGIPDFRGLNGIYTKQDSIEKVENTSDRFVNAQGILTPEYFKNNTLEFYRFYINNMIYPDAKPNTGHEWLRQLEKIGKNVKIITQNIDGLHIKAGSQKVYEMHGNAYKYECTYCHKRYVANIKDVRWPKNNEVIPICPLCKHKLRPDIVLYGESVKLPNNEQLDKIVLDSDLIIIMGTQLQVQPANQIPKIANGKVPIYIINLTDYNQNEELDGVEYEFIQSEIKKFVLDIQKTKE